MIIADFMAIGVETSKINNNLSLKKEFIKLIFLNP